MPQRPAVVDAATAGEVRVNLQNKGKQPKPVVCACVVLLVASGVQSQRASDDDVLARVGVTGASAF